MAAGVGAKRSRRVKRRAWALGLILLALAAGAVAAARPLLWRRGPDRDPLRLGLLYGALNEFNARRFDRAAEALDRRAAEVEPVALDWMLRARIAEARGRPDEALDHLRRIPDSDPIGAQSRLKAGQIELARHHARAAEGHFRRAQALDPDQIQSYRELAYLYATQRRRAECDAQFRALAALMPLDHVLAFAWCQTHCDVWDPYAAREVLEPFVEEDPADRPSRLALATSFQRTREPAEALAVLEPLPEDDADARALRAQLALDQGEVAAAEALSGEGPAGHVRLECLRGQLALHRNDPERAAARFRAALEAEPEDRDATHGLGLALRRLGDPRAGEFLERASRQDQLRRAIQDSVTTLRTDPRLFGKLGELCESLGRREEARAWYRLAIGRDPLDAAAQQGLARLGPAPAEAR